MFSYLQGPITYVFCEFEIGSRTGQMSYFGWECHIKIIECRGTEGVQFNMSSCSGVVVLRWI